MSGVLDVLEQIEAQDKAKKDAKKTPEQRLAEATRRNARQGRSRPLSQPPSRVPSRSGATTPTTNGPSRSPTHLSPDVSPRAGRAVSAIEPGPRAQSQGSESRRISFAEAPRTITRSQVKIPTRNDSLSSGFPFLGEKLSKFSVSAKEWAQFSNDLLLACDVHHYNAMTWPLARSKVIKRVRNDLKYGSGPGPGPISAKLRLWNRAFRSQGFQVSLELPSEESAGDLARSTAGMSKDAQKEMQKQAKRFRIVVDPLDGKGGSIYSRSSLRGSVSGEGNAVTRAIGNMIHSSTSVKENAKEEEEATKKNTGNEQASSANGGTNGTNGDASVPPAASDAPADGTTDTSEVKEAAKD